MSSFSFWKYAANCMTKRSMNTILISVFTSTCISVLYPWKSFAYLSIRNTFSSTASWVGGVMIISLCFVCSNMSYSCMPPVTIFRHFTCEY